MPLPHFGVRLVDGPVVGVAVSERSAEFHDLLPEFADTDGQALQPLGHVLDLRRRAFQLQPQVPQLRGHLRVPRRGAGAGAPRGGAAF